MHPPIHRIFGKGESDELQELIRVDTLSVLVRIFRRQHHITLKNRSDFEAILLQFCSYNSTSRQYFLKSDALPYVRDVLMGKWVSLSVMERRLAPTHLCLNRPQSPFLLTALSFVKRSESVAELHNRLISCEVLVPLARCLALTSAQFLRIISRSHLYYCSQELSR
ncbi:hypothetical protein BS47DRAFT_770219 [Hydnum rufescens UP504]|uniref:Uncharacterized protein n=1 Tax=Hydnum rufescens UP504 TaxID=1448309 RepID=A0A9P6DY54_9AGAM|nr:hypothetical protein BS47DRAFT_770219 [Hydnum rufescens UP504]